MTLTRILLATLTFNSVIAAATPETLRIPLSGKGPADAVEWDFQVSAGRRAGVLAKIPVPSQWEQHGFGGYDYGWVPVKDKHKENGIYQRGFKVPDEWRGLRVRLVFEGAMTDTSVTVNGQSAGPTHQGGFYQFAYDITDKIQFGKDNRLEVLVNKVSANPALEKAERGGDYWVFGGIYRPVWLEARPPRAMDWTAIDASADGTFRARVYLDGAGRADRVVARVMTKAGEMLGEPLTAPVNSGGTVEIAGKIPGVQPWSAEEPNLYQVEFCLLDGTRVLHRMIERCGFRTLGIRQGKGLFVNGTRIRVKGVNRHCFRPESGRALDPQTSIDDVKLIKSMNMNAVRCAHYPPDKAFLEACDELGLYVENELCTWGKPALDTPTARRLIGQMIRRDVNHPSILWWANGNEGGWNKEVDPDFAIWDIQQRPVLHPWEDFSGFQTKHYPTWTRFQQDLAGPSLVMPTEFLHGLYDGGHGAGLEDFWNTISTHPNAVGGFLWALADEGIMRTDRDGAIDTWGDCAPDGIVGPHHEKEASYLTIRDIFCPVQIDMKQLPPTFDGRIGLSNRYDFRNLSTCVFRWRLTGIGAASAGGDIPGPAVTPGEQGELALPLPSNWSDADALELTAVDRDGFELWTWAWPVSKTQTAGGACGGMAPVRLIAASNDRLRVAVLQNELLFDGSNGRLISVKCGDKALALTNGPRLVGKDPQLPFTVRHRSMPTGAFQIEATSQGQLRAFVWTVQPDGRLDLQYDYQIDQPVSSHGITFDLAETEITHFSWTGQGPERVWANRMRGTHYGTFGNDFKKLKPGLEFDYPQRAGFFAGILHATITTRGGPLRITCHQPNTFLRLGTHDEGERIKVTWPEGDFSILHAIPGIGNKFNRPEDVSPQGALHPAPGKVSGKVSFSFEITVRRMTGSETISLPRITRRLGPEDLDPTSSPAPATRCLFIV